MERRNVSTGRCCSGLSAADDELSVQRFCLVRVQLYWITRITKSCLDDVELPMVSMLSTQARDSRLTTCSPPGNGASMKPTQELGVSNWDNG